MEYVDINQIAITVNGVGSITCFMLIKKLLVLHNGVDDYSFSMHSNIQLSYWHISVREQ